MPTAYELAASRAGHEEIVAGAAKEESARLMSLDNQRQKSPSPDEIELRQPILPENHAQQIATLDKQIYETGLAVDSKKLVSAGKELFSELLDADRLVREHQHWIGSRTDLTSWPHVLHALGNPRAYGVPERTVSDELNGSGREWDEVSRILDYDDLWKVYQKDAPLIRAIHRFWNIFVRLIFAHSLSTWVQPETERVHHRFFAGGSGEKVRLFETWLPQLKGRHYRVRFPNSLAHIIILWLCGGTAPPNARSLSKIWSGLRQPTPAKIDLAQALLEGWLCGHKGFLLRQFVGRFVSRRAGDDNREVELIPDKRDLEVLVKDLTSRFEVVGQLHRYLDGHFFKSFQRHQEFQPHLYRQYVDSMIDGWRNLLSQVAALAISEHSQVVGRFHEFILCEGEPKPGLEKVIGEKLGQTFPRSRFEVVVEAL